jgi:tetratricopeptide (TPR) repeat protein
MKSPSASRWLHVGLLLLCMLCTFVGCSCSATPGKGTAAGRAGTLEDFGGELVTEGEYYEAALAIEAAATQTADELGAHFDMYAICQTAVKDLKADENFKAASQRAFVDLAISNPLGTLIDKEVAEGGSYSLLRVTRRGEQHYAAFRLIGTQGLNYHNLKLNKNNEGRIVASDLYALTSGELMSVTLRRTFLPAFAERNKSFLQQLVKPDSEYIASVGKWKQITDAFRDKDYPTVITTYHTLPKSVQKQKPLLIMRLLAAAQLQDKVEYAAAQADYKRLYPNDPGVDMLSLDALVNEQKFDEALAAIDRIDRAVGGDHHLDVTRAAVNVMAGNLDESERLSRQAIEHPQAVVDSHWQLIAVLLKAQKFEQLKQALLDVEHRFQVEFEDLQTLPDYAEFVKSPQYQEWLQREPIAE